MLWPVLSCYFWRPKSVGLRVLFEDLNASFLNKEGRSFSVYTPTVATWTRTQSLALVPRGVLCRAEIIIEILLRSLRAVDDAQDDESRFLGRRVVSNFAVHTEPPLDSQRALMIITSATSFQRSSSTSLLASAPPSLKYNHKL